MTPMDLFTPINSTLIRNQRKKELLTSELQVISKEELTARYHVMCEMYAKDMVIEAKTLKLMIKQNILPAVFKYKKELVSVVSALEKLSPKNPEYQVLEELNKHTVPMMEALKELQEEIEKVEAISDVEKGAEEAVRLISKMECVRNYADVLEENLPHDLYPFPNYNEILHSEE